jgi:hypothetical protein
MGGKKVKDKCKYVRQQHEALIGVDRLPDPSSVREIGAVCVPIESGGHFDVSDCESICSYLTVHGVDAVESLVVEDVRGIELCCRVDASVVGLQGWNLQYGHFDAALGIPCIEVMIYCTVSEFFCVIGREVHVEGLIGKSVPDALSEFAAFAGVGVGDPEIDARLAKLSRVWSPGQGC